MCWCLEKPDTPNVETVGVYFGNDNPAAETFQKILPNVILPNVILSNVIRSMNYWKQFRLCKLRYSMPQNYGTLPVFTPFPHP